MIRVYSVDCDCGWHAEFEGGGVDEVAENEASDAAYRHYDRNKPWTLDDLDWVLGTGRYAQ